MKEEESLSEKIKSASPEDFFIEVKEIKEFIKQLKIQLYVDPEPCCFGIKEKEAFDIIDRLCGDKLIEVVYDRKI